MKCPHCNHLGNKVIDSKAIESGTMIKRRRKCRQCSHRWTTMEAQADVSIQVVKRAHQIVRAFDTFKAILGDVSK